MNISRLCFGSVICWKDIPHPHGPKARLFICLGRTQSGTLLLTTTTSNVDLYRTDLERKAYRVLLKARSTPFSKDCMVDFNRETYPVLSEVNESKISQAIADGLIEYAGTIYSPTGRNALLADIYKKMVKACQDLQFKVTFEQLQAIFSHYAMSGISVDPPPRHDV